MPGNGKDVDSAAIDPVHRARHERQIARSIGNTFQKTPTLNAQKSTTPKTWTSLNTRYIQVSARRRASSSADPRVDRSASMSSYAAASASGDGGEQAALGRRSTASRCCGAVEDESKERARAFTGGTTSDGVFAPAGRESFRRAAVPVERDRRKFGAQSRRSGGSSGSSRPASPLQPRSAIERELRRLGLRQEQRGRAQLEHRTGSSTKNSMSVRSDDVLASAREPRGGALLRRGAVAQKKKALRQPSMRPCSALR